MVPNGSGNAGPLRCAPALVVAAAVLLLVLAAVPQARAADADAAAIAPSGSPSALFVGGSATFPNDARSAVAGRYDRERGAFGWLWRVDATPLAIDTLSDLVVSGGALFGIGYANGKLLLAKFDPATGTLSRSCDGDGVATIGFDAGVLPGKAVALGGGDLAVVGGTLARPTRGMIAVIDGATCTVRRSVLAAAADASLDIGFTALDRTDDGDLLVAGFEGNDAALLRFTPDLRRLGGRTFDLGGTLGENFAGVRADGNRAVAIANAAAVLQCVALPGLEPDANCGAAGRRTLSFGDGGTPSGVPVLAAGASGGWLVAGAHSPQTTVPRAALAIFGDGDLAPGARQVFDPFPYMPSAFSAMTASDGGIAGVGVSGYYPSRTPFLFSAAPDGTAPAFKTLSGFDTAAVAPVEPDPLAQPPSGAGGPPSTGGAGPEKARLATWRFILRKAAKGRAFGTLRLRCAVACTARGVYSTDGTRVGATTVRLAAGNARSIRLRLSAAGRRRLARDRRLRLHVRFTLSAKGQPSQTLSKRLILHLHAANSGA